MTVAELRERLSTLPAEAIVCSTSPNGDMTANCQVRLGIWLDSDEWMYEAGELTEEEARNGVMAISVEWC